MLTFLSEKTPKMATTKQTVLQVDYQSHKQYGNFNGQCTISVCFLYVIFH